MSDRLMAQEAARRVAASKKKPRKKPRSTQQLENFRPSPGDTVRPPRGYKPLRGDYYNPRDHTSRA